MKTTLALNVILISLFLQGCATVFKGYYDTVDLRNAPDDLRITTAGGLEVPISRISKTYSVNNRRGDFTGRVIDTTYVRISLRSNEDHILVLSSGGKEKRVQTFRKIGGGWIILNVLSGGVPLVIDAITGNWNFFDPIDASVEDNR
ncbi:MAG TPA: hypothetical protein VGB89_13620 [Bacteroidota bacterium]